MPPNYEKICMTLILKHIYTSQVFLLQPQKYCYYTSQLECEFECQFISSIESLQ